MGYRVEATRSIMRHPPLQTMRLYATFELAKPVVSVGSEDGYRFRILVMAPSESAAPAAPQPLPRLLRPLRRLRRDFALVHRSTS